MSDAVFASQPEPPPSSESLDALTRDRRRRQKRLLIGLASGVVVMAGGVLGLFRYQDARGSARIAEAWSAFGKCTIGATGDPGELPSRRFRAAQLTAMTLPEAQRA